MKRILKARLEARLTLETELRNLYDLAISQFGDDGRIFLDAEVKKISKSLKIQVETGKIV